MRYYRQYYDIESGMTYLKARYYDSSIRRFIMEDPIKDGLNWYAYAGNNPVMFFDPSGFNPEKVLDENGTTIDVRYDLRTLVNTVGGVLKVENNIVYIKAMGQDITIDLESVSKQDANLSQYEKHNINGSLHYTMKEFFSMFNVDFTITTAQIQITEKEARYSKYIQKGAMAVASLFNSAVGGIFSAIDDYGPTINSIREAVGLGIHQNFAPILDAGFYKKQYIEINLPTGRGIISNYIVPGHVYGDSGIIIKELWNADMSTIAYGGYNYPF